MRRDPKQSNDIKNRQIAYFYPHSKRDKIQEIILRVICLLISISIIIGSIYFILNGGIEKWEKREDLRPMISLTFLVLYSFLSLTTIFAIYGDKASNYIQKRLKK